MPKHFTAQDKFFHKAQKLGYRARSAFKLEAILERFPRLPVNKKSVLDLGCAPGGFLQILKQHSPASLIGVDLQEVKPIKAAKVLKGDVFSKEIAERLKEWAPFHLITSDLAPNTSGIKDVDQWHSVELCQRVLELCNTLLKSNGSLVLKIFVGEDFDEFWRDFRGMFSNARIYKPKACRDRSFETYLIGEGFKRKH